MMKDKGEDLDHFPVAAWTLEKMLLQASEGLRQIDEGRVVAQGARLALEHRQIMAPVINRSSRQMMGALDDPRMFAQDLPFRGDDDPLRVDLTLTGLLAKEAGTL